MNAKNLSFSEIKVGDTASFSRVWTEKDVIAFAELSGDENPLHLDEEYAKTKSFGQRLVHGMLLGSLCSALVGMYLPGKRCLYLSQKLVFKNPVFISDTVDVRGTVTLKSQSTKVLSVFIVMKKGEEVVVEGEAWVRMI
jgi:3-hydroxybutyryl-CoA dehydratase